MTWKKGESGNPYGPMTAKQAALKRRLEGLTFKAVDALEKVLNDDEASHSERLAAAREVFDRAIGRPKQQAAISVEHNTSPHLSALIGLSLAVQNQQAGQTIDGQAFEVVKLLDADADADASK